MARLELILGGARSGKSRFAQARAQQLGNDSVLFVATAEARDDEMSHRIDLHRRTRNPLWSTLEADHDVGCALSAYSACPHVILIDCLTLLVSNVLLACADAASPAVTERAVMTEIDSLLEFCKRHDGFVIVVSSEVGLGLVPETPLGRRYRDLLGWANQKVAAQSDATYLLVAGLAVNVKHLAEPQSIPRLDASTEVSP